MPWGRKPSCACGECPRCKRNAYMRAYYRSKSPAERHRIFVAGRDPERVRQSDRERYADRQADPDYRRQARAHHRVWEALRSGRLERRPCEVCGSTDVQAHHEDYDKPLDVRWLCPAHHAEVHTDAAS